MFYFPWLKLISFDIIRLLKIFCDKFCLKKQQKQRLENKELHKKLKKQLNT